MIEGKKVPNSSFKTSRSFLIYAKMIDSFISFISAEGGLSKNTSYAYSSDLKDFGKFIYFNLKKTVKQVGKEDIRSYINYLYEVEMEQTSVSRKLSSIKRFFHFLVFERIVDSNPVITIESPKRGRRLPKYISDANIKKMIEVCKEDGGIIGIRDRLIIEMIYTTGLRVSEIISIRTTSILHLLDNSNKEEAKMIYILGKGNKERAIPISNNVLDLIREYIDCKRKKSELNGNKDKNSDKDKDISLSTTGKKFSNSIVYSSDNTFLFSPYSCKAKQQKHITREAVYIMLKKRASQAGFDQSIISPHVLRHSFATNLCSKDVSIRFVQELLGHSSISTTEIYLHTMQDKIVDFVEESHPFGKLKKDKDINSPLYKK